MSPEESVIAQFLADATRPDPLGRVRYPDLHAAHVAWCAERGYTPLGPRRLGKLLWHPRHKSNSVYYLRGIRLRPSESPQA